MVQKERKVVGGSWAGIARRLHAQHFRHLFQDPHYPWHGAVTSLFVPPANRLVLLIDGIRVDKFFETDSDWNYRAPCLRSVIKECCSWRVSRPRLL